LGEFLVDLHIHSNFSPCSILSMEDIIECLNSYDIKGVALTDHNTIDGYSELKKIAEKYDIKVFKGYELVVENGELLVYGISKVLPAGLPPMLIIKKVREDGGAVFAAHPYRRFLSSSLGDVIYDLDIDGVEISDRNTHYWDRRAVNAAKKMDVAMIAGSDAHHVSDIGWCATKFNKKITTDSELVNELKEKRCEPVLLEI